MISVLSTRPFLKLIRRLKVFVGGLNEKTNDLGLPVLAAATDSMAVRLFDSFYRAGSLVFGGGHVVLPLLQAEVVEPGWV